MEPLVFSSEANLVGISKESKVKVIIEISLPPPEAGKAEDERVRKYLDGTYKNIAKIMAAYISGAQYIVKSDPEKGMQSVFILFKHLEKAGDELISISKDGEKNRPPEREYLISYQ